MYFKTVRNGPEWISQYDGYPKGTFENFVQSVELLEDYYDSLDFDDVDAWKKAGVDENYNNTKAKYKLVMKSPEFLEHVKETEEWDGRFTDYLLSVSVRLVATTVIVTFALT